MGNQRPTYVDLDGDESVLSPRQTQQGTLASIRGTNKTKRVETDATGNVFVNVATSSSVLPVTDILTSGTNGKVVVPGTAPVEAKVGATRFANRKVLMITAQDSGLYWGFTPALTTVNGTALPKGSCVILDVGNVAVYVVGSSATTRAVSVVEAA